MRDKLKENFPDIGGDPDFTWMRGCAMWAGVFVSVMGILIAVYWTVESYTDGLLGLIALLLALILMQLATRR